MTETFRYRTLAVEGRDVVLEVRPTLAGDLCAIPLTRSFFAHLLAERGGPPTVDQSLDVAWLTSHLDELVTSIVVERLRGMTHEQLLRSTGTKRQIPIEHLQPTVTLRATMHSEAIAAAFSIGSWEGTRAFDVWQEDPRRAVRPDQFDTFDPFGPFPDAAKGAKEAVLAKLPGWETPDGHTLRRSAADARLTLSFVDTGETERPGFEARYALEVPAMSTLGSHRVGESVSPTILSGQLQPPFSHYWFRRYVGAGDTFPELATFVGQPELDSTDATYAHFLRLLDPPVVDALLTRAGVLGLIENIVASYSKKELPRNHRRLGTYVAPPLGSGWKWTFHHQKLLWTRVALHAVLGTHDDARAAIEQARARMKVPPRELKRLYVSLVESA
ncbi:hypothetical protein [Chondromyces crocatus]|uniref:Uncharacterized protein n=1 Tax=Chondromyces crocatus TaxID=52 RepID=A0A0K1EKF8_CHOCO|nr:hypothetical protein [Chondromyces crocatus]AKT41355.1 uncharacterized protein CMC5_055540 [Chondromyces crocatus]